MFFNVILFRPGIKLFLDGGSCKSEDKIMVNGLPCHIPRSELKS